MNQREISLLTLLTAIFIGALVAASVLAAKIVMIGGLVVPAGVLAYSITFAMTDTVCEIWGKERTRPLVNAGFVVLMLVFFLNVVAIYLPPAPFWPNQEAFASILGSTSRIIFASLVAYGISQTLDIWLFSRVRELTGRRHLWLRNNISTLLSQTLDTAVFITIAFYGEMPLLPLIGGQLVVKYLIALVDTPVVYGLVYLVRLRLGQATPATGNA